MDEIVKDFLIESTENLDRLDQELVKLEEDPQSNELLASIFRTIHTIKGSAGFLGFMRLQKVAHSGENLLSRLRDRQLSLTAEITSGLLAMVDAVRRMLAEIGSTEQDGENDYPELLETLARLQSTEQSPPASAGAGKEGSEETVARSEDAAPPAEAEADSALKSERMIRPQKNLWHRQSRRTHRQGKPRRRGRGGLRRASWAACSSSAGRLAPTT
jgi:two-component system, chemotaxis family, sensor kinase CheA